MKRLLFLAAFAASLISCSVTGKHAQWTVEQAGQWWNRTPWPVGCCYVPTYAVNQLEMWQADTFNPEVLDREFAICEQIGFNTVRVYMHELPWLQDAEGFKSRIDSLLTLAHSHGIKVTFTFCTNGGGEGETGPQPAPLEGVHGGGRWVHSPLDRYFFDRDQWPQFKAYVQDILRTFGNDSRILYWCLYNEPENIKDGRDCLEFMKNMYQWAWEVRPSQPLTSPIWIRPGQKGELTKLDMVSFVCENSDIISFHCYYPPKELETFISMLRRYGRPLICQEYLARNFGSTFQDCLPILKKEKVGALNWGLAEGKCEYRFPWGHKASDGEPDVWFHSILWNDYTPYSQSEIDFLKETIKTNQ